MTAWMAAWLSERMITSRAVSRFVPTVDADKLALLFLIALAKAISIPLSSAAYSLFEYTLTDWAVTDNAEHQTEDEARASAYGT
jgi:hypothetical protein